jgi:1,4-alpha-glucan branching enzyme
VVVVANFTPQSHSHYRVGVPLEGFYAEVFNTDSSRYGGSNLGNLGGRFTDAWAIHDYQNSLELCLPPLSVVVLRLDETRSLARPQPGES